jgi:hypothetical protein
MKTIQPIGAYATIQWEDEPDQTIGGYYFSFGDEPDFNNETEEYGEDSFGMPDSEIFFYCNGEHQLKSYMTKGKEEFIVLDYQLVYDDFDIEHANLMSELEHNK